MSFYGYHGSVLEVNLTTGEFNKISMDENWYRTYVGGGLMGGYFLLKSTASNLDPLSPDSMIIFVSSIIAGQAGPGLAKFSVVGKSPLSGGIAESRGEGPFSVFLKKSGFDAIIIKGKSDSQKTLVIENGTPKLICAEDVWGMDTIETGQFYKNKFSIDENAVISIGKAGENLVKFASLVTGGGNQAARLGMGAVMGSKLLKSLVIIGGELPPVFDEKLLKSINDDYSSRIVSNDLTIWQKEPPGFSASADLSDFDVAYIGFNNYQDNLKVKNSAFERKSYLPYYRGEHNCPNCDGGCMKRIGSKEDSLQSTTIHQEVTGSFGPNVGNLDLETVLKANSLCNKYGIDPVSMGFTISFAMECGENGLLGKYQSLEKDLKFGNSEILLELIEKTVNKDGIGNLLANGVKEATKELGEKSDYFAMHVKGVEMVSFEPRTQICLALGYAIAPFGPRYDICEHDWDFDTISGWPHSLNLSRTIGIQTRIPMEEQSVEKVARFKSLYTIWSACDALNLCIFASAPTRLLKLEQMAKLIYSITGIETSSYEIMMWGEKRNHLMRMYNVREGFTSEDDMLPKRFFENPISFGRLQGSVLERKTFTDMILAFYEMVGWDQNGVPKKSILIQQNLGWLSSITD